MHETGRDLDTALAGIDEGRRAALRRLIVKGAFVAPVVASFAMSGLTIEQAAAQSNTTASGRPLTSSDGRLKRNLTRVATPPTGFGIYRFKYLWSNTEYLGVIAQEVLAATPEAVVCGDDGFLRVDYAAIGMRMELYAA